mmetsp:Transcript_19321/g.48329  ORF Transcript_19321/g.48329 Transcript_19321/m.48329 type:complete len:239 (+) Transcript_19321:659-1375(+)
MTDLEGASALACESNEDLCRGSTFSSSRNSIDCRARKSRTLCRIWPYTGRDSMRFLCSSLKFCDLDSKILNENRNTDRAAQFTNASGINASFGSTHIIIFKSVSVALCGLSSITANLTSILTTVPLSASGTSTCAPSLPTSPSLTSLSTTTTAPPSSKSSTAYANAAISLPASGHGAAKPTLTAFSISPVSANTSTPFTNPNTSPYSSTSYTIPISAITGACTTPSTFNSHAPSSSPR